MIPNRKYKKLFPILVFSIAFLVYFLTSYYVGHSHFGDNFDWKDKDFDPYEDANISGADREIVILRWTKYFGSYSYKSPMIFRKGDKCFLPSNKTETKLTVDCRITYDRQYFGGSSALIFHLRDLNGLSESEKLPPFHPKNQIWILQNHESPANQETWDGPHLKEFNWTINYRKDSDFYDPYGLIVPLESEGDPQATNLDLNHFRQASSNKTKLVAWIVSNCKTAGKREDFVKELQKHIPIDIYGYCGSLTCRRNSEGCYADIAREYKFYLSFENSLCVDYVTEKFFNAMSFDIVPVVYGGANYSEIAPPNSFINARDFKGAKELADYLMYLDSNLEEYLKYFEWKVKYKVLKGMDSWCGLCQKIHEELLLKINKTKESSRKWYRDIAEWWKFQINSGKMLPSCEEANS